MKLEIHGAGFQNKGAQLMLRAVLGRLATAEPVVHACMSPTPAAPYRDRAQYGLFQIFPIPLGRRQRSFRPRFLASRAIGSVLPGPWLEPFGLVTYSELQGLLDLSGYAFGDVFSWRQARAVALRAEYFSRRGLPVVFLPQMVGPFDRTDTAREFRRICAASSAFFVRDEASLAAAIAAGASEEKIQLAPDLTIFEEPDPLLVQRIEDEPFALLVPNRNVLTKDGHGWGEHYLDRLVAAGKLLQARKVTVRVLIHGAEADDAPLAEVLTERLDLDPSRILTDADPTRLKAWIARAELIVASRFHAVVAALSTGTPSITLGWAHKYEYLHRDFQVGELVLSSEHPQARLEELIDRCLDPRSASGLRSRMVAAKDSMHPRLTRMWDRVFSAFGLRMPLASSRLDSGS